MAGKSEDTSKGTSKGTGGKSEGANPKPKSSSKTNKASKTKPVSAKNPNKTMAKLPKVPKSGGGGSALVIAGVALAAAGYLAYATFKKGPEKKGPKPGSVGDVKKSVEALNNAVVKSVEGTADKIKKDFKEISATDDGKGKGKDSKKK